MLDSEVKELEKAVEQIWEIATKKFGLDPFPVHFEIVPATVMYEIGSYALPGRYSHWSFGKAYHKMKMMYDLGLSKIYEVVINSNPAYAFLLENNSLIQNKMVIAHVLGHVDFFKNNVYFSRTNRRMIDEAATHARRIAEYEFKYGRKVVEEFLDAALSIEEHVDPDFFIKKGGAEEKPSARESTRSGRYDDLFSKEELGLRREEEVRESKFGQKLPEKDLVYFIMKNSPALEEWQRDIMAMLHEEMEYFIPQMQTKILNEGWACATGDSLLLTERGFIRFDQLYEEGEMIRVAGGGSGRLYRIAAFHKEEQVPTIRIRTRKGLTIEGAFDHRLKLANGSWARLRDLKPGDRVAIEIGTNVWPKEKRALPARIRSLAAPSLAAAPAAATILQTSEEGRAPEFLDEDRAWLLGYIVGGGVQGEAGIDSGGHCRTLLQSGRLLEWSQSLGIEGVLPIILGSPKEVVSAFLSGYFDANAVVDEGISISSPSEELIRTIQIILLNYGILSSRECDPGGLERLQISGASAARFLREIGSRVARKRRALRNYVESRRWPDLEENSDEIVSIEYGRADVFDITVESKHAYVANGFVNHNSYWHSRIMRELDLTDSEYLEFAELHANVISPHKHQLSPYYLGYKILEDIEKRWDNPTQEERERFGRKGGEGREKIFEVRELENDISLLRNYLTKELCEEMDLFIYELIDEEEWTVTEKRWERVRDQLVANMTNFGFPYIEVVDGDYRGTRALYLRHRYEGVELDLKYAKKTLEHVYKLWGRDVYLETVVDEEPITLHYNGREHIEE
jgi:stage V sporulation protein R